MRSAVGVSVSSVLARHRSVTSRRAVELCREKGRCRSSDLRTGVIGDGLGHVERGVFAALATSELDRLAVARRVRVAAATGHVVGAEFAFRDDASDSGFKTRGHFGLLQPVEHRFVVASLDGDLLV